MIDANVAVWSVLPLLGDPIAAVRVRAWQAASVPLMAPSLWIAEATSTIRRAVFHRLLTADEGRQGLETILALGVEVIPMTGDHARSALDWAARLGQVRAYDAFYLALAEDLGTDFWTADRRLVNAAHAVGAPWAHWVGEPL